MNEFKNGDKITELPCCHLFTSDAIEEWVLNNQSKCPVCRYQLKNVKELRCAADSADDTQIDEPVVDEPVVEIVDEPALARGRTQRYETLIDYIANENQSNPLINDLNRLISMFDNLIIRNIQRDENEIMQQSILASLREQ